MLFGCVLWFSVLCYGAMLRLDADGVTDYCYRFGIGCVTDYVTNCCHRFGIDCKTYFFTWRKICLAIGTKSVTAVDDINRYQIGDTIGTKSVTEIDDKQH